MVNIYFGWQGATKKQRGGENVCDLRREELTRRPRLARRALPGASYGPLLRETGTVLLSDSVAPKVLGVAAAALGKTLTLKYMIYVFLIRGFSCFGRRARPRRAAAPTFGMS